MTEKVVIPEVIYDGLLELNQNREDGLPDYRSIKDLASARGLQVVEDWLHNNMKLYEQIRLGGMEPDEKSG